MQVKQLQRHEYFGEMSMLDNLLEASCYIMADTEVDVSRRC